MKKNHIIYLLMVVSASVSAFLFYKLNIPLPWMLGPMFAIIILKLKYPAEVYFSITLRNWLIIPLGYNIGAQVTSSAVQEIMNQLAGITIATFMIIFVCIALAWWTTRVTGVSFASSAIGNMPGGLTPMLLLCESIPRADVGVVAILQSLRLMGAIAVVPIILSVSFGDSVGTNAARDILQIDYMDIPVWLLVIVAVTGAVLGHYMHMPADFFLGPLVATSALSLFMGGHLPEAPNWLMALAQIATGMYLGTCIDPLQMGKNKKLLIVAIIGVVVIIATSLLIGYILSIYFGFSVATAFLACAPGGVAEMCITGMVMGENVPIILSYQLFRLLFLNFIMPISLKWYFTR